MSNETLINELQTLLGIVAEYEYAINRQTEINNEIKDLEDYKNTVLDKFDREYLPKYIKDKIGDAPKSFGVWDPKKLIKAFSDKRNAEIEAYNAKKEVTIRKYYEDFSEQRTKIDSKAQNDFNQQFSVLNQENQKYYSKIENFKLQITKQALLPQRFVNSKSIKKIITYLEDWRADSVKEGIAILCFEEEFENYSQKIKLRLDKLEERLCSLNESMLSEINVRIDDISSSIDDIDRKISDYGN